MLVSAMNASLAFGAHGRNRVSLLGDSSVTDGLGLDAARTTVHAAHQRILNKGSETERRGLLNSLREDHPTPNRRPPAIKELMAGLETKLAPPKNADSAKPGNGKTSVAKK